MKMFNKLCSLVVALTIICSLAVIDVSAAATTWGPKDYSKGKTQSETFTDSTKTYPEFLEHNKYEYYGNGTTPSAIFGRAADDNSLKIYNTGAYSTDPANVAAYRRVWTISKPNTTPANCKYTAMRFYIAFGGVRERMYIRATSTDQTTILKIEDTKDYFPEDGKWYRTEILFDVTDTQVQASLYVDGALKLTGDVKTVSGLTSTTNFKAVVVQFQPGANTPKLTDADGTELFGYETAETYIDDLYFYYDTEDTYTITSAPTLTSSSTDFKIDGLNITTSDASATVAEFKAALSGYTAITVRNSDGTDAAETDTIAGKYVIVDDFYTKVNYAAVEIFDSYDFEGETTLSTGATAMVSSGKRKLAYYNGDITPSFTGGLGGKASDDEALLLTKVANASSTAWDSDVSMKILYSNRLNGTDYAFSENVTYELSAYASGDIDSMRIRCKLTGESDSALSDTIANFKVSESETDAKSMHLAKNQWNRLAFKFFIDEDKYEVYVNGALAKEGTADAIDADDLNHFMLDVGFDTEATAAEAELAIDDLIIYVGEDYVSPSVVPAITTDSADITISEATGNIYMSSVDLSALKGDYRVAGGSEAQFGSVLAAYGDYKIYNYYTIKNSAVNTLELVRNQGKLCAEALLGAASEGDEITVIIAEYNSNNSLVNAKSYQMTLDSTKYFDCTLTPSSVNNTFKAFIWTSTDDIIPVTKAAGIE